MKKVKKRPEIRLVRTSMKVTGEKIQKRNDEIISARLNKVIR